MTAGQGPGPYGNPPGQGGAPEQPDPQGWGASAGLSRRTARRRRVSRPTASRRRPPPYAPPSAAAAVRPAATAPPSYPGYGVAPSAPTGYGAPTPVERPLTVRAGIGAFVGSIVLSLVPR